MPVLERTYGREVHTTSDELLISSDSHVIEPAGLWQKELPSAFKAQAPDFGGQRRNDHPGAMDKTRRVSEMASDGVSAEVLYPTHGLRVLSLENSELEAACCRVYNDWLIDYCSGAPDRLIGLAMLSVYDIDQAILEMQRCRQAGLRGAVIWQVPPPQLSFASDHYERLWAAAQEMNMPINLHILSGHGYSTQPVRDRSASNVTRDIGLNSVNQKMAQAMDALYDFIFSGVFERFPRLKLVFVENEIGWMPFLLEQWDYYFKRNPSGRTETILKRPPSEYFHENVYATFFN